MHEICYAKLKLVAPKLQATKKASEKYEDHFGTYRRRYQLQPYPVTALFLCGKIRFC